VKEIAAKVDKQAAEIEEGGVFGSRGG